MSRPYHATPAVVNVDRPVPVSAGWATRVRVPSGSRLAEGHFPGRPVVPAVGHLLVLQRVLERLRSRTVTITGASSLRFLSPVAPPAVLEVTLSSPLDPRDQSFRITLGGDVVSQGRIEWSESG